MESEEVSSPVQFATALALIITQVIFLFSLSYWFGFSAVSGINVVRYLSLIEIFTSITDRRLGILIILLLINSTLIIIMMAQRGRRLRFMDDPAIKVPPRGAEPADNSELSDGKTERYMTPEEVMFFKRWISHQRYVRWLASVILIIGIVSVIWLWLSGKPGNAIRLSMLIAVPTGVLLSVSNALAFITLQLRSVLSSILMICCISANIGATDASVLMGTDEGPSFPNVALIFDGHTMVGRLIFQTSTTTLLFDPLRRFTSLSNSRISETRYLPQ